MIQKLNVSFFSVDRITRGESRLEITRSGAEFETSWKERVCLHATRPPITLDNVHIAVRRCMSMQRGIPSCRLAPALIYSRTVADARDEELSHQRTPPTLGTHDRRADAYDQKGLWLLKDLLESEGCL